MRMRTRKFFGAASPWIVVAVVLASGALALALKARAGKTWGRPNCRKIKGTYAVTFTTDEGATLATSEPAPTGITDYTFGLVALGTPNTLLAVHNRTLQRSTNAGCRWTNIGEISSPSDSFPLHLTAAVGRRAYTWADGRIDLARVDGIKITYLKAPVSSIVGLRADPTDKNRVRLGGDDATLWESRDGGVSLKKIGNILPGGSQLVYRAAFNPRNLDHVLFGTATTGAYVSTDGGKTWTQSTGLSSKGTGSVNVFNFAPSPVEDQTVWAMGIDLAEADAGAPSEGKHIYLSRDGGISFAPVVDNSAAVKLTNGPVMVAHPTNPHVLYFLFGSSFQHYGTDVYKYDATTGQVTTTHNAHDGMGAIAFNPADAKVMYLGLSWENFDQRSSK